MSAFCTICGHTGAFLNPDKGREGHQCPNCSASSRNRLVMLTLGRVLGYGGLPLHEWPADKNRKLLESSPRGPHVMFLQNKFDFVAPEFDPGKTDASPEQFSDVQDLKFSDDSFDVVLSSDVFEHVRHDERGFREVLRVLKPGGSLILTVPYSHSMAQTEVRVQVDGDEDIHLMEPRYHGGGGSTLQYRTYGRDLMALLNEIGYAVGHFQVELPQYGIAQEDVFVAQNAPALEFSPDWLTEEPVAKSSTGPLNWFRLFVWWKWNWKSAGYFAGQAKKKA